MTDIEKQPVTMGVVGVPIASTTSVGYSSSVPMYQGQEKQGSKCCGCCCDFRRAVIVVNIIFIVLGIISIISALANTGYIRSDFDDDQVEDDLKQINTRNAIFSGIGLAASILSLIGAIHYNICFVAVNMVWLVVQYIAYIIINEVAYKDIEDISNKDVARGPLVGAYVIQAVIYGLFIYPHAGFIHEVKRGITSRETYPREEYSCCCTARRY